MEKLDVIVDMQYGSTGKGLLAGYLSETVAYDTIVTAWAPNAGHTYIDSAGRKYVHTHLANGVAGKFTRNIMLGPGSLINPEQLLAEMNACEDLILGRGVNVLIHPHAAIVRQEHVDEEAGPMTKIGSTKKGVGAAMIQRIRRDPDRMNIAAYCEELRGEGYVCTVDEYRQVLHDSEQVLIEGAQGYGLSMYHGFYPFTTSRDVSTFQLLADSGIQAADIIDKYGMAKMRVIGTCRTFPIRVANRYDSEGTQVGYSGPCYDDQYEISFEDIGQKVELTTVTKLPRRIFTFSGKQIFEACKHNGVYSVFLNFLNYVRTEAQLVDIVQAIEREEVQVRWVGTGPTFHNVHPISGSRSDRIQSIISAWRKSRELSA